MATPSAGQAPLLVNFSGATSTDSDGAIIDYVWSFGDSASPATASGVTVSHTYPTAGVFTVLLTVTDNSNATSTDSIIVTVGIANAAPIAVASGTPTTGKLPLTVAFDGTSSHDDGSIASYAWNFDDPSSPSNTAITASPSHTYTAAGSYTATLTVTDDQGATGTASVGVTVSANQAPVVFAAASPTSGKAPLTVGFDSAGTTDNDGTIASLAWDFGDDNNNTSSAPTPSHVYNTPGTYTATLTATDDSGDSNTASVVIVVNANVAPTAAISTSATTGVAHFAVNFGSAASTDSDGSIVSRSWNFGDGNTSTDAAPQNLYTVAGTYTATLTVTDDNGDTGTATQTITVTDDAAGRYVAKTGADTGTCQISATPCLTVQYAVNQAAATGNTVYVNSGAYAEMVYVAKDLNFKGANQGISAGATPGTRRAESTVKGIRNGTAASNPGTVQRNNSIDGMAIDPQGDTTLISANIKPLVWLVGGPNSVIQNNTFTGAAAAVPTCGFSCTTMTDTALEVRSGAVAVTNNGFTNLRRVVNFYQTAPAGVVFTTVSFTGNKLTNYTSRGLQIAPSGGNKSIAGVSVSGNVFDATGYGAGSSPGSIVVTTGTNTYTNNTFIGSASGIYLYLCTAAASSYVVGPQTITNNTFTANGTAVAVFPENPAACTIGNIDGSVIHNNSMIGTGGIGFGSAATYFAGGRGALDATCNWWGAGTGPNTAGASTATASPSIVTSPWLSSSGGACDGS